MDTNKKQVEALEQEIQHILAHYKAHTSENSINQIIGLSFVGCDVEKKEIVLEATVQEWQLNPLHTFHGGMMATLFDAGLGLTVRAFSKESNISTVNLSVSYLRGVKGGEVIRVVCRVTFLGRTMVHMVGEAWVADKLVATATGAFILLEKRQQ